MQSLFSLQSFIQYFLVLWIAGLIWLYIVSSVLLRKLRPAEEADFSDDENILELISMIGVGPFFVIWLFVTPALFGDSDVPLDVGFIAFPYWLETLLYIALMLLTSYFLVSYLIKSKTPRSFDTSMKCDVISIHLRRVFFAT